jgi:hypothetical protein
MSTPMRMRTIRINNITNMCNPARTRSNPCSNPFSNTMRHSRLSSSQATMAPMTVPLHHHHLLLPSHRQYSSSILVSSNKCPRLRPRTNYYHPRHNNRPLNHLSSPPLDRLLSQSQSHLLNRFLVLYINRSLRQLLLHLHLYRRRSIVLAVAP